MRLKPVAVNPQKLVLCELIVIRENPLPCGPGLVNSPLFLSADRGKSRARYTSISETRCEYLCPPICLYFRSLSASRETRRYTTNASLRLLERAHLLASTASKKRLIPRRTIATSQQPWIYELDTVFRFRRSPPGVN